MRKIALLLSVLLVISAFAHANPVDIETAKAIGAKFLQASTEMKNVEVNSLEFVTAYKMSDGNDAFYVFNSESGFVIVAADDCATPIIGYSTEGQFITDDLPIQMQEYLNDFVEEIQYGIENETYKDETTIRQWELVKTSGRISNEKNVNTVDPLLTTTWHQNQYYNNMCPADANGPGGHVLAGCVATAMGQVMKYWNEPTQGTNSHSYVHPVYGEQSANFGTTTYYWTDMPNALSSTSSATQIEAVATLLYQCGVAVNMNYGTSGSGANSRLVPDAMKDYFSYTYSSYDHRQYYTDDIWLKKVKASLESTPKGCPVYYTGQDENGAGGHAFVCDGYDANDYLHFNWGWSGNNNNYFPVNALNVSGYRFNKSNLAIFHLRPQDVAITTTYTITASSNDDTYGTASVTTGSDPYHVGDDVTVTATAKSGYSFLYWTEGNTIVSADATYSFKAEYSRNLVAQFAEESTIFHLIFDLYDTYGDGWTTNILVATYPDSKVEYMTLKEGHYGSFTRNVVNGSTINLTWIDGFYNDETQFFIKNEDGHVLYENTTPSADLEYDFTVDCDAEGVIKYYFNGAANANWSNSDNWISNAIPTAESAVSIKSSVLLDVNATIASLSIDRYDTLFIQSGKKLTVTGAITLSHWAIIAIEDGGQLVQSNSNIRALVEKNVTQWTTNPDYGWHAISTPIDNVVFDSIYNLKSSTYNVYRYDEATHTWENSLNNNLFSSFDNGRGYIYRKSDDHALYFMGKLNVCDVEYPLSHTSSAGNFAGFHLIGNPYSHNIKKGVEISNQYLETGFYTLKPDGSWEAGTDNSTEIAPGQAVLVQAKNTVTNEKLVISDNISKASDVEAPDYVSVSVSNSSYHDVAYAILNDGVHGLNKIDHRNVEIQKLYINYDNESFAIAEMSKDTKEFNLNFKAQTTGNYTLAIDYQGDFNYIHLFDKFTGDDIDMLIEDSYSFVGSPSDSEARFVVRLGKNNDDPATSSGTFVYQNGNEVIVNGSGLLQVYDVTGRLVMHQEIIENQRIDISGLPRCVYIFRLTGDTVRTQKVVLQ